MKTRTHRENIKKLSTVKGMGSNENEKKRDMDRFAFECWGEDSDLIGNGESF